jgi:hypothetical protein
VYYTTVPPRNLSGGTEENHRNVSGYAIIEVSKMVTETVTVLLYMKPCSLVDLYGPFRGTKCSHQEDIHLK